jgi:hypothetical protein
VLLAIIGEQWLTVRHGEGEKQGQRRLDDPDDFVRIEVSSALARGIPVIPVLVDGARMPGEPQLPEGLKQLAYHNATEVGSERDFHAHVVRMIRGIEGVTRREGAWEWGRTLRKALLADRVQRYATADALAADLRRLVARPLGLVLAAGAVAALVFLGVATWLMVAPIRVTSHSGGMTQTPSTGSSTSPSLNARNEPSVAAPIQYRGRVDVLIKREKQWLRLNELGALPMRRADEFRIDSRIDPLAYAYVVWVDPGHDVTPVYPWDPTKGWGSRPTEERPVNRVSLPRIATNAYTAKGARAGVATIVLLAGPTPLDVTDKVLKDCFERLPDLPLPPGGQAGVVWFDDFHEVHDPERPRTFQEVSSADPFAQWQGQLQQALGGKVRFQTAVSFARVGGK